MVPIKVFLHNKDSSVATDRVTATSVIIRTKWHY